MGGGQLIANLLHQLTLSRFLSFQSTQQLGGRNHLELPRLTLSQIGTPVQIKSILGGHAQVENHSRVRSYLEIAPTAASAATAATAGSIVVPWAAEQAGTAVIDGARRAGDATARTAHTVGTTVALPTMRRLWWWRSSAPDLADDPGSGPDVGTDPDPGG